MDAAASALSSVFVTAAGSGLGVEVTRRLTAAGYRVAGAVQRLEEARQLRAAGGMAAFPDETRAGEIRSAITAAGAQAIVHLAPQRLNELPLVKWGWDQPAQTLVDSAAAVMDAARQAAVQFVVGVSSALVYGDAHGAALDESAEPGDSDNEIVAALRRVEWVVKQSPVPSCILRAGFVYGAATQGTLQLRQSLLAGRPVVMGDSHAVLNWIHVDDMADAVARALQVRPAGEVLNVVDDQPVSASTFVGYLAESMDQTPRAAGSGLFGRATLPKAQMALLSQSARVSNARAKQMLGWTPRYPSYRQGIDNTLLVVRAEEPVS